MSDQGNQTTALIALLRADYPPGPQRHVLIKAAHELERLSAIVNDDARFKAGAVDAVQPKQPDPIRSHIRLLITEFAVRGLRISDASRAANTAETENEALGCLVEAAELADTLTPLREAIRICVRMKS
ncbi:MAG TPA: hypothetical protein VL614_15195 [Acetobacteraceae bacterium]|jgi:hypothetical protein|nr:hypothetical protein [Acetobacteraceae bacterium]